MGAMSTLRSGPLAGALVGGVTAFFGVLIVQRLMRRGPFGKCSHPKTREGPAAVVRSKPRDDGFRMPAEWEEHDGCWLLFPYRLDNWRDGAKPAQKAYAAVANAIALHGGEKVTVGCRAEEWETARALLDPQVRLVEITCDDAWIRDTGPTFVVREENGLRELRGVDWGFNAYGGENGGAYNPYHTDTLIAQKVLELEDAPRYKADFILEGGSIHVDGEGTCLTTEECLLNPNRNPHLSRQDIEERLKEYLNVTKIIWLQYGAVNDDDTNGHIDNMACFARPGEVILHWTDDVNDPQYARSMDALKRLESETDAKGRKIKVHKLPLPGPMYYTASDVKLATTDEAVDRHEGQRMAASYVNFYIANEAIILPQYGEKQDVEAMEVMKRVYPEYKVVGVQTRDVILGGGNIHCVTQQQPKKIW